MFDTVCKFLVETFSTDFATWLLGKPATLTELSPSELSLEPIRADALILLQSEETILHLEFQSRPDSNMAFRMADYRLRVYRRFPEKAMRQVVIYLQPSPSDALYQTTFEIPGTRHEFEVIRLWEQPSSIFLSAPGLLPFTVLSATEDRPDLLRQVARQIETLPEARLQSNVAASTAILAGLLLDKDLIQRILRKEMMQESVIYQDIKAEGLLEGRQEGRQEGLLEGRQEGLLEGRQEGLLEGRQEGLLEGRQEGLQEGRQEGLQEGRQEGLQEGRQEGLQEGRQEGLQEGRRKGEVSLVCRLLRRRFGTVPETLTYQINELSLAQLEGLGEALLEFGELTDLETWLNELQRGISRVLERAQIQLGELPLEIRAEVQALSLDLVVGLEGELSNWSNVVQLQNWLEEQKANEESFENRF